MHSMDEDDQKDNKVKSSRSTLVDDLTNADSELARFLLANEQEDDNHGLFEKVVFDNSLVKSVRNFATQLVTGEDGVKKNGSLGTSKAW